MTEVANVVVVGGGVAGLATAYRLQSQATLCTLVEATQRCGGKVATGRRQGFVLEGGPDAFVPAKPQALELEAIEAALPPGLFLAGNAYRGVGLSDCIQSGSETAAGAARHLREQPG